MLSIRDIPFAVDRYENVGVVDNSEIARIFGYSVKNTRRISQIKSPVFIKMKERNIATPNKTVDIGILFEEYGIDIAKLRKRMRKR